MKCERQVDGRVEQLNPQHRNHDIGNRRQREQAEKLATVALEELGVVCDASLLKEDPPAQDQRPEHCSGPEHLDRVSAGMVAAMDQSPDPQQKVGDPQPEYE